MTGEGRAGNIVAGEVAAQPSWVRASPRRAALAILAARFPELAGAEDGAGATRSEVFETVPHQEDAVVRATRILQRYGGVIIADSVGTGKSLIGLRLIESWLRTGRNVVVVTPAALGTLWRREVRRCARAVGNIDTDGLRYGRVPQDDSRGGSWVAWLSHTRLSRDGAPEWIREEAGGVLVDEAHGFRNPATRRYRALAELCSSSQVVLLTATPVNNSMLDLYFQIRLFAGDGAFADQGVPDLRLAFPARSVSSAGSRTALLAVLREVVIRRTRVDLTRWGSSEPRGSVSPAARASSPGSSRRELVWTASVAGVAGRGRKPHRRTPLRFPQRAPPEPVRYHLDSVYQGFYDELGVWLGDLRFAALRSAHYRVGRAGSRGPGSGGAGELLRLLLLKRLESCVSAFRASVKHLTEFHERFLTALAGGHLLGVRDYRRLYAGGAQLVLEPLALGPTPPDMATRWLEADVRADLAILEGLACRLAGLRGDPKVEALRTLLAGQLAGHKVLVFSEFRDTARHLWRSLRERGGVGLIDGSGAFLGHGRCPRRLVLERFAPRSNGVPEPPSHERVDLLIATDVLAEGLNLQDAGHVVSYDLPWNPVRLIQRVGRIDRLGSPHSVIHIHNFVPEGGLEQMLGLLERLGDKLTAIRDSMGGEGPVLGSVVEEVRAARRTARRLALRDPGVLAEAEADDSLGVAAREEALRALFVRNRGSVALPVEPHPAVAYLAVLSSEFAGARTTATAGGGEATPVAPSLRAGPQDRGEGAALVALGSRSGTTLVFVDRKGRAHVEDPHCGSILRAAIEDPEEAELSAHGHRAQAARVVTLALQPLGPPSSCTPPARRPPPGVSAGRLLLRAVSRLPGGPEPELLGRVENLLAALSRGLSAGGELATRRVLDRFPADAHPEASRLLRALEEVVHQRDTRGSGSGCSAVRGPGEPQTRGRPSTTAGGLVSGHGSARDGRVVAVILLRDEGVWMGE